MHWVRVINPQYDQSRRVPGEGGWGDWAMGSG